MAICKDEILERIGPEAIFRRYIDHDFVLRKTFKSELREERNASANVFRAKGTILYNDFADEALNCFGYVMKKYGVDFREALEIIARDFNLESRGDVAAHRRPAPIKRIPKVEQLRSKFEYRTKPLEKHEIDYFEQFNVTQKIKTKDALEEYDFIPLRYFRFFSTRRQEWSGWIESTKWEPTFLIKINENEKIYRPLSKSMKWLSNTTADDIFGAKQIKDRQVLAGILAGQKDILSMYMNTGYRGLALSSEGASFTAEKFLNIVDLAERFFIMYDNDKTGIKKMKQISDFYPITPLYLNSFLRYSTLKNSTGTKDVALWYKYMKDNNLKRDRVLEMIQRI